MTTYRPQSLTGKRRGSCAGKAEIRRAWICGYNAALRMVSRKPTRGVLLEAWKQGKAEGRSA